MSVYATALTCGAIGILMFELVRSATDRRISAKAHQAVDEPMKNQGSSLLPTEGTEK